MGAGRPIKPRKDGFQSDVMSLARLRVALRMNGSLDKEKAAEAVKHLDGLSEILIQLTESIKAA
jgi:hypothetical protein